jgi:hypothetical protein
VDHIYFPFAAGPHPPPPPPHAPMGMNEQQQQQQQLLLYATDATCQQTSTSDGQAAPQEVSLFLLDYHDRNSLLGQFKCPSPRIK